MLNKDDNKKKKNIDSNENTAKKIALGDKQCKG
jgi:hypothetical protein